MEQQLQQRQPFAFTGNGGEYFRIWIVNLCLSLLTLGIYSAWAKVRRTQYFYRHTSIAGANFDYHGDPKAILKGRIIATGMFAIYSLAGKFNVFVGLAAFGLIMAVMPWLLVRSLRFRLHNTSYRGLRFSFHGKVGEGYTNFLVMPIIGYASLGLLWPLAYQQIKSYQHNNSAYGDERFKFEAKKGVFYKPFLVLLGVTILLLALAVGVSVLLAKAMLAGGSRPSQAQFVIIGFAAIGMFYLGLLLFAVPYLSARLQNIVWNATSLGPHRFESQVGARGLFGIMLVNFLLIVLTLGLFKPFADIRLARYRIEHMALLTSSDLDEFVAGQQVTASAAGEEMAEMFDVDIAI